MMTARVPFTPLPHAGNVFVNPSGIQRLEYFFPSKQETHAFLLVFRILSCHICNSLCFLSSGPHHVVCLEFDLNDLHSYQPVAEVDHQLMEQPYVFVDIPVTSHITLCCNRRKTNTPFSKLCFIVLFTLLNSKLFTSAAYCFRLFVLF